MGLDMSVLRSIVSLDSKQSAKVDYLACRQCKRPVSDKLLNHLKQFCWHFVKKPDRDPYKWESPSQEIPVRIYLKARYEGGLEDMTFLDIQNAIMKTKMELHKDITSLEAKVDKSNAALYREIKETNRKLDMILEELSNLGKEKCNNPE